MKAENGQQQKGQTSLIKFDFPVFVYIKKKTKKKNLCDARTHDKTKTHSKNHIN